MPLRDIKEQRVATVAACLGALFAPGAAIGQAAKPSLPQVLIDTTLPDLARYAAVKVRAGADLQAALDKASCDPNGTVLRLASGATFKGHFTLPARTCAPGQWIIIRTDIPDSNLPAPGVRINPSFPPQLAKIPSDDTTPTLTAPSGANRYWLLGVEIGVTESNPRSYGVFMVGSADTSASTLPYHIFLDRCYVRGNSTGGIKNGLVANGILHSRDQFLL